MSRRIGKYIRANNPLYSIWNKMMHRCYDERNAAYKYYGARGIKVCDRWRESFDDFVDDMGPRPEGNSRRKRMVEDGTFMATKGAPEFCSKCGEQKQLYGGQWGCRSCRLKANREWAKTHPRKRREQC